MTDKNTANSEQHPQVRVDCGVRGDYSNRQWLNPDLHPSTGSVVAYHGESPWNSEGKGKPDVITVLEIADCHNKVRLHRSEKDTLAEFIIKMETLNAVISNFAAYLRGL